MSNATKRTVYPSKIIFLDIDGVLQPGGAQDRFKYNLKELRAQLAQERDPDYATIDEYDIGAVKYDWHLESVERLRRLCDYTGARIIISSTWRESKNMHKLELLFNLHNLDKYLVGATPVLTTGGRDLEIAQVLVDHLEIRHYIVIDDGHADVLRRRFPFEFVHTRDYIEPKHYEQAVSILEGLQGSAAPAYRRRQALQSYHILQGTVPGTSVTLNLDALTILRRSVGCNMLRLMEIISEGIAKHQTLTHLSVNGFGYDSVSYLSERKHVNLLGALVEGVAQNHSLQTLDISDSGLEKIGPLLDALERRQAPLERVIVGENRLDEKSQKALCAFFARPHPIGVMDLRGSIFRTEPELFKISEEHKYPEILVNPPRSTHSWW